MKQAAKKASPASKVAPVPDRSAFVVAVTGLLILTVGLFQAINLRWLSDDAFITFRYVQNFVAGHGIVYNIGEYVEGYTHFLWLLILSGAKIIGFDPVQASIWLGITCYAAILILLILISYQEQKRSKLKSRSKYVIPLAAALLALNYDMNIWASGGLETALYTFFISLAFFTWFYTELPERKRLLTVGSILILATLTRPDGALFILTALILLAVKGVKEKIPYRQIARKLGAFIIPSVLIGIPYLLWKYGYYGDIFPTPYYAKSASASYFEQGFFYIFLFFRIYISAGAGLIIGVISLLLKRSKFGTEQPVASRNDTGSPFVTACIVITVYLLLYVARVGGDFMFARFMIPILPLLCFLIEGGIFALGKPFSAYRLLICIALLGATFVDRRLREKTLFHYDAATGQLASNWDGDDGGSARGIADERWVYTRKRFAVGGEMVGSLDVYCDIGKYYEPFFQGLPIKVAIMGGQNSIAYYANFANCIDIYGLTDSYIAHLPITKRGRIGHEKEAPDDYLLRRGVHLEFFGITGQPPEDFAFNVAAIEIPQFHSWQLIKVINYDDSIMAELYRRFSAAGIHAIVPVYAGVMSYYLNSIVPKLHSDDVETDYKILQYLYFNKHPDQKVQNQLLDSIAKKKKQESLKTNIK